MLAHLQTVPFVMLFSYRILPGLKISSSFQAWSCEAETNFLSLPSDYAVTVRWFICF